MTRKTPSADPKTPTSPLLWQVYPGFETQLPYLPLERLAAPVLAIKIRLATMKNPPWQPCRTAAPAGPRETLMEHPPGHGLGQGSPVAVLLPSQAPGRDFQGQ